MTIAESFARAEALGLRDSRRLASPAERAEILALARELARVEPVASDGYEPISAGRCLDCGAPVEVYRERDVYADGSTVVRRKRTRCC